MVNAGDYEPMPIDDYDTALFARLNAVNYLGPVNVLRRGAAADARARRWRDPVERQRSRAARAAALRPYSAPKAATIHLAGRCGRRPRAGASRCG